MCISHFKADKFSNGKIIAQPHFHFPLIPIKTPQYKLHKQTLIKTLHGVKTGRQT
jgi:hypothetical protein